VRKKPEQRWPKFSPEEQKPLLRELKRIILSAKKPKKSISEIVN
jgi:hypothetical protein